MKTLFLPLKKEWYEMIERGEKKEEYREIKPYYCSRILNDYPLTIYYWECILEKLRDRGNLPQNLIRDYGTRGFDCVRFSYGYTRRTMTFEVESITIGQGRPEWGAPDCDVFIIKLGRRI